MRGLCLFIVGPISGWNVSGQNLSPQGAGVVPEFQTGKLVGLGVRLLGGVELSQQVLQRDPGQGPVERLLVGIEPEGTGQLGKAVGEGRDALQLPPLPTGDPGMGKAHS